MTLNRLAALGSHWYVGYLDGTTVKGGIVSFADAGNGTTTISTATLFSSATLADAIIVGSNKVLAISAQSSLNANILTDNAGVAGVGTAITLSSQTTRACLYASGTDVYVQDGTSDYIVHKIDCSGASPVHAEVLIGGRSSAEIAQFTASNYVLSRSPKAVYGANYARNVWRSAKTQNFDPEVRLGKFSQRPHIDYIADDSSVSTAFRGSSQSSMWAASVNVNKSYVTKVECVA